MSEPFSEHDLSGMPVTITLVVSEWRTILAHLQVGTYQLVAPIIDKLVAQSTPQLEAVQQAARQETGERPAGSEQTASVRTH